MRLPLSSGISSSVCFFSLIGFLTWAALPRALAATGQLEFSPATLRFGKVEIGQSETQLVTLTNTGSTSVTISAITAGDSEFVVAGPNLPAVVQAGQTVSWNVQFTPTQKGWFGTNIKFTNSSDPNLHLAVSGLGGTSESLTASPTTLSFGQVTVGASTQLPLVVTNSVSWKVTLNALQTSGNGFSVSGPAFPIVLSPGQSVSLSVAFAPLVAGVSGGSILISPTGVNIPLSGTGTTTGQLGVSPASLNFGSVDVGSSSTLPASLTATGGSVTVTSGASSSTEYSIAGASFPLTINAGQSMAFNVVFAPTATGTANGTLSFTRSGSTSKSTETVSGSGIVTVNLSWTASTSSVVGYNVYRGTTAGSYSKINSSLDPGTTYGDTTVTSGVTYYYAATAVNSSGEESAKSSPVTVAVP